MNRSAMRALIRSDLQRHSPWILLTVIFGLGGLLLLQIGGEMPTMIGAVTFYTSLIVFGCILPTSNVIIERKKQILPFLMSLPLSITQYTAAKLVSTLGIYLAPWSALVIVSMSVILGRQSIPDGLIPSTLILSSLTLVGFCLIAGVAVVTGSEALSGATMIMTNSTYGISWYLLIRDPAIREGMRSPEPLWSTQELTILGAEAAAIVAILGLAFYLQSRKRDFV